MVEVRRAVVGLAVLLFAAGACLPAGVCSGREAEARAVILELDAAISPGTAMYVARGIKQAGEEDAEFVVLRVDTPGGLASSMRTIVKAIMNSSVPVVVYVGPKGAGAASAGVMVTVAGHVAAMAPGTNIGAAHPVGAGGGDIDKEMSRKVVNDMAAYGRGIAEERGRNGEWVEEAIRESVSITAEEALEKGVVDLIAGDMDELFEKLDQREVEVGGRTVVLETARLERVHYRPDLRDRILETIGDPNIAYILMMIGLAGLYFELSHPGALLPGVIGAISLILAFFSFQALPVNYAGLLLIALAIIFFIAEIMVSSWGLLSVGGLISLILGSIMLFEEVSVSLKVMAPTIVLVGGFFVTVAWLAFRAYRTKPMGGSEGMVGAVGTVKRRIDPEGVVMVRGETWRASSDEVLDPGEEIEVVGIRGLVLQVKRARSGRPVTGL
jgi:membrane-bound serine protease (ClpP class)